MHRLEQALFNGYRNLVALNLWQVGAISANVQEPYRLVSGKSSPVYIDCRKAISSLTFVDLFLAASRYLLKRRQVSFDCVAGGESAGIPFAAFLARSLGRPMIYVRKQPKAHGLFRSIEGSLSAGERVLLVEDLITDGSSKVHFIEEIRGAGGIVTHSLVVLDRLQGGQSQLEEKSVQLLALADIKDVLHVAEETSLLGADELSEVRRYLASPDKWTSKFGMQPSSSAKLPSA